MSKSPPNRFAAWQEANQVRRESVIDEYLAYLEKTRVRVRHVTDLADLVAKHLVQTEGHPCSKSTLLRNLRYKAKLLTYQVRTAAPGTRALDSRAITDPAAKALITSAELEHANRKRELERLEIYTASLEDQLDLLQGQGRRPPDPIITAEPLAGDSDYEFRFIRTCQALRSLLSHLNVVVHVDASGRRILDMSKRRDNVIVDKEVAGPFVDWLVAQGGVTK